MFSLQLPPLSTDRKGVRYTGQKSCGVTALTLSKVAAHLGGLMNGSWSRAYDWGGLRLGSGLGPRKAYVFYENTPADQMELIIKIQPMDKK